MHAEPSPIRTEFPKAWVDAETHGISDVVYCPWKGTFTANTAVEHLPAVVEKEGSARILGTANADTTAGMKAGLSSSIMFTGGGEALVMNPPPPKVKKEPEEKEETKAPAAVAPDASAPGATETAKEIGR